MDRHHENPDNPGEIRRNLQCLRSIIRHMEKLKMVFLNALKVKAGDLYDTLETDKYKCIDTIRNHPSRDVRWAALQILLKNIGRHPEVAGTCKKVLAEEKDPMIRSVALRGLSDYCKFSRDMTVFHIFSDIMYDDSTEYRLKRTSYFCILDVLNIEISNRPSFRDFNFPDDVDWTLVALAMRRGG